MINLKKRHRNIIEIYIPDDSLPLGYNIEVPTCKGLDMDNFDCRFCLIEKNWWEKSLFQYTRYPLRKCLEALTHLIKERRLKEVKDIATAMYQRVSPPLTLIMRYKDGSALQIDYDYNSYPGKWAVIRKDNIGLTFEREDIQMHIDSEFLTVAECYLKKSFPNVDTGIVI